MRRTPASSAHRSRRPTPSGGTCNVRPRPRRRRSDGWSPRRPACASTSPTLRPPPRPRCSARRVSPSRRRPTTSCSPRGPGPTPGSRSTHPSGAKPTGSGCGRRSAGARSPALASDHAPHSAEAKGLGFERAPSGMPGVDTMLPLLLARVRAREVTLPIRRRGRLRAPGPMAGPAARPDRLRPPGQSPRRGFPRSRSVGRQRPRGSLDRVRGTRGDPTRRALAGRGEDRGRRRGTSADRRDGSSAPSTHRGKSPPLSPLGPPSGPKSGTRYADGGGGVTASAGAEPVARCLTWGGHPGSTQPRTSSTR